MEDGWLDALRPLLAPLVLGYQGGAVKALPNEARRKNGHRRKGPRQFCPDCDNTGYVVVALRKAIWEEHGPCPFCEQGLAEEFDEQAPWGDGGFWQGRELPELQSLNPSGNKLLPAIENRRRMRELAERMGAIGREAEA